MFGNICTCYSHSKSNISFLKSRCIICTITSNSHHITAFSKSSNKQVLIFRSRPGQHSQRVSQFLEFVEVLDTFIYLVRSAVAWTGLLAILAVKTAHPLVEFRPFEDTVVINTCVCIDNIALLGYGHGCNLVVTCYHTNCNTCSLTLGNCIRYFFSDNIFNTNNGDLCESSFLISMI